MNALDRRITALIARAPRGAVVTSTHECCAAPAYCAVRACAWNLRDVETDMACGSRCGRAFVDAPPAERAAAIGVTVNQLAHIERSAIEKMRAVLAGFAS